MELKKIQDCDVEKCYQLFAGFPEDENGFVNETVGMDLAEFTEYVALCADYEKGKSLPEGYVPCTKYILINDEQEYVGIFNLRHRLTAFLRSGPGHIGYGIHPDHRRKGYAKQGLRICLEEAKAHGIKEVYLSCLLDNEASYRTQLACGAILHHDGDGHHHTRIFVK